ncbi:MAG TPA: hypothetical protein VKE40_24565 [Gemmataceae bacterium]|nr:hypothetical protein [Gemmataceae bacterium]
MTAPDWLTARNGGLTKGLTDRTWLVTIAGEPQYRLDLLPAKGQYTCSVIQTNNGRRLDDGKVYPKPEAALTGGLEELRAKLGW